MDPLCSQCENPGQGECIADGGSRGDVLATPFSLQDWIHLLAFGEPPPNPAAEPKTVLLDERTFHASSGTSPFPLHRTQLLIDTIPAITFIPSPRGA
ncbi:hypothetical protein LXA43DRAFT_1099325 [Ganoderma leucocontextum]|nr:hypothetical protein LXA43DRAFT_1099325 [Ganoderma leucocontextum]